MLVKLYYLIPFIFAATGEHRVVHTVQSFPGQQKRLIFRYPRDLLNWLLSYAYLGVALYRSLTCAKTGIW